MNSIRSPLLSTATILACLVAWCQPAVADEYKVVPSLGWSLDLVTAQISNVTGVTVAATGLTDCGMLSTDSAGNFVCEEAPSGSGDITAVGDVASGAAFNGSQGTVLTFNDADGDQTVGYNTGSNTFGISATTHVTGSLVVSAQAMADSVALKPGFTVSVCRDTQTRGDDTCDYQADGTDDQEQIDAALQVVKAQSAVSGQVVVMEGRYSIGDYIDVPNGVELRLQGASIAFENSFTPASPIDVGGETLYAAIIPESYATAVTGMKISGWGRIHGQSTTGQSEAVSWVGIALIKTDATSGVYGDYLGAIEIDHIGDWISSEGGTGGTHRFFAVGPFEANDSTITGVYGHHTGDDVIGGRRSNNRLHVHGNIADDPEFGHCYQVASSSSSAFGTNGTCDGNRFYNNYCLGTQDQGHASSGIATHSCTNTLMATNYIQNTGSGTLTLGDSNGVNIVGNTIISPAVSGIEWWTHSSGSADITSGSAKGNLIILDENNSAGVEINLDDFDVQNLDLDNTVRSTGGTGQDCHYFESASSDAISGVRIRGACSGVAGSAIELVSNSGTIEQIDFDLTAKAVGNLLTTTRAAGTITNLSGRGLIYSDVAGSDGLVLDDTTASTFFVKADVADVCVNETNASDTNRFTVDCGGSGTVIPTLVGASSWAHELSTNTFSGLILKVANLQASGTVTGAVVSGTHLQVGSDYITDITGSGLSITQGVLSSTGVAGSVVWNDILDPDGNQVLDMDTHDTSWSSVDSFLYTGFDNFVTTGIKVQIGDAGDGSGCLMFRDTDDAGYTECDALNGTLSCSTDADGVCD